MQAAEQDGQAVADSRRSNENYNSWQKLPPRRRNKERNSKPCKKVLSSNQNNTDKSSETFCVTVDDPQPLFPEIKGKRSFSTLRAPSARRTEQDTPDGSEDGGDVYEPRQLRNSQWFCIDWSCS
jgi:hypothetical protein